ncbi:dTDP-4-amino-4,6-dideoxygalactose transaminase [Chitinophaga sp. 212800010-3]|uniref:dTDP-4-amino-4,6-dideoxygalactose transaminase n=1 Tax=unclassified Chitinophaga TaxID=2619133 RepID=UPI002DEA8FCC|nr:TDP-4-oxo-6-deoxy-D-glucose transaminase [Chitinophaga sp. 212800010-3]
MIPFNKPYLTGKEAHNLFLAAMSGKISGDGIFTKKCHEFFEKKYGFNKVLLTTSCTDALEMAAILLDIQPGDEVIAPSYTFVSSVNAFVLRGAKIVFADSEGSNPNLDAAKIEQLITPKTRVIVPVHYAGVSCDMDAIMAIAEKHGLYVVEDAAQAIDSYYKETPLGSIGHFAAFSFHETKNVISGEGGMLVINDKRFADRAEIIREKGTNRSQFFRGEVDKYGWVDIGSSFLPSDIIAAFLHAQLENLEEIQARRIAIWQKYQDELTEVSRQHGLQLPFIPEYATNNAHMFYVICKSLEERTRLISWLRAREIHAVFHYLSLHKSPYSLKDNPNPPALPYADHYTDCLLRLPMYYELTNEQQDTIINAIKEFYQEDRKN